MTNVEDLYVEGIHYRLPSYQRYKTLKKLEEEILKLNLPYIPLNNNCQTRAEDAETVKTDGAKVVTINEKVRETLRNFEEKKQLRRSLGVRGDATLMNIKAPKNKNWMTSQQQIIKTTNCSNATDHLHSDCSCKRYLRYCHSNKGISCRGKKKDFTYEPKISLAKWELEDDENRKTKKNERELRGEVEQYQVDSKLNDELTTDYLQLHYEEGGEEEEEKVEMEERKIIMSYLNQHYQFISSPPTERHYHPLTPAPTPIPRTPQPPSSKLYASYKNEYSFVQQKVLQVRYVKPKDVRTTTVPVVKFCRGCQESGYHKRCIDENMYIQRLGGSRKSKSHEDAQQKNIIHSEFPFGKVERTSQPKQIAQPRKHKNKIPLRFPKVPDATHCKYCLHQHDGSDVFSGSTHSHQIKKSNNKNKSDFLTDCSNRIPEYRKHRGIRRNLTVPLEAVRGCASHLDEKSYTTDDIVFPYTGNYLMNGGDALGTDTYEDILLREYYQLAGGGFLNTPFIKPLSTLRIDGIRKEPLPPIRSTGHVVDSMYIRNNNGLLEAELGLLVKPDVKKIKPGFRTRKTWTHRTECTTDLQQHDANMNLLCSFNDDNSVILDNKESGINEFSGSENEVNLDKPNEADIDPSALSLSDSLMDSQIIDEYQDVLIQSQLTSDEIDSLKHMDATGNESRSTSLECSSTEPSEVASQDFQTSTTQILDIKDTILNIEKENEINSSGCQSKEDLSQLNLKKQRINDNDDNVNKKSAIHKSSVDSPLMDLKIFEEIRQKDRQEELDHQKLFQRENSYNEKITIDDAILNSDLITESSNAENEEINESDEHIDYKDQSSEIDSENEKVILFDVPPIPQLAQGYSEHERVSRNKTNKNIFSSTSNEKKKKKLRKPPKSVHLTKRFQLYKSQRNSLAELDDPKHEDEETMLDFASKYCILSLDQLNRYEKVFNEFSTKEENFEKEDENDEFDENWKNEMSSEILQFLSDYEEVCYEVDLNSEKSTQIITKKKKLEDELKQIQEKFTSLAIVTTQAECLQMQADIVSRIRNCDKQYEECLEKQKEIKNIQKELKDFLTSKEDLPEGLVRQIKSGKDAFKQRFLKRKSSFIRTTDLYPILRKLNFNFKPQEMTFVEKLLQLPDKHPKLDLKMFSIVAAMSEKITDLDSSMKIYLEKIDLKAMERRLEKCKELYELINDQYKKRSYRVYTDKSAENLFAELHAGGMNTEEMRSITEKLVHNGRVDFLDFAMYIPLFLKIHDTILKSPFL